VKIPAPGCKSAWTSASSGKLRVKGVADVGGVCYLFVGDAMLKSLFHWFEKKRLADWFEKISAAFMVGSVLSEINVAIAFMFSIVCLVVSQALAKEV
jgi:hypothetical protein